MVSPVLYERRHSGGFIVMEGGRNGGMLSRDTITLLDLPEVTPPAAPSLTAATGGAGALGTGTFYFKATYQTVFGETIASLESSHTFSSGSTNKVTAASPSSLTGVTGWNLYAGTVSGAEVKQNSSPIAIGTSFEVDAIAAGSAPPTIEPAPVLPAGLVLGKISVGSSGTYTAGAGNTGNFTITGITIGAGVVEGTYSLEFIAPTVFNVYTPSGELLGEGTASSGGVAFSAGGLGFTATTGSTAAVAGDNGTIAIAANSDAGIYVPLDLSAADGRQTAAALLFNETDTSQGNLKVTAITRQCEVNGSELIYPASASSSDIAAINADLAALGIIVR